LRPVPKFFSEAPKVYHHDFPHFTKCFGV